MNQSKYDELNYDQSIMIENMDNSMEINNGENSNQGSLA